jgi:hypothetical protein
MNTALSSAPFDSAYDIFDDVEDIVCYAKYWCTIVSISRMFIYKLYKIAYSRNLKRFKPRSLPKWLSGQDRHLSLKSPETIIWNRIERNYMKLNQFCVFSIDTTLFV